MSPSIVSPPVLTPHSQSAFTAVQPSKSYRAHLSPMVREGGREGGKEKGREGWREGGRERGWREGGREGWREGGREGGRERGREGGWKEREPGKGEKEREGEILYSPNFMVEIKFMKCENL